MRATIGKPARQRQGLRPGRRRREESGATGHERPARPAPPEERSRREGGPQDRALYVCRCGSAFQAIVTASVTCPHCGEHQAW